MGCGSSVDKGIEVESKHVEIDNNQVVEDLTGTEPININAPCKFAIYMYN